MNKLELLPEETSEASTEEVTWKHYEYIGTGEISIQWVGKEKNRTGDKQDSTKQIN